MTESTFCPNCGERISARALFCSACGARQDEFEVPEDAEARPAPTFPTEAVIRAVPAPEPKPPPAEPSTAEFVGALKQGLALPGVLGALIAGATAAGVVLVAGLVIAIITPDRSLIGAVGADASLLTETFRQAVGTLLTPMIDTGGLVAASRRIHPLILLAIPLAALAFAVRWQLPRTAGAPPLVRLAWALLVAVPFGLLMCVFAVLGGETESTNVSPSAGNALLLGWLWGLVGALIGAASKLPLRGTLSLPPVVERVLVAAVAALRPLAVVLLVSTLLALVGWLVQVGADAGAVREGRSAPTALVEEAVYAPEHGIELAALGAGVLFRPDGTTSALGLPFPVSEPNDLPGADGAFRIFAYDAALPAYVFLPVLVLLLGLNALGALYAGFAAARAVGADRPPVAAAWGALTGPVWAVTMALLAVLAGGLVHGDVGDGSLFGIFLLGGALLGAAGGALSASGQLAAARSRA